MTDARYAEFDRLLIDRPAPHVLRVTINRPEKYNALDDAAHNQLERIWAAIDADPDVSVSIVTGQGKAFSAGGDVSAMGQDEDQHARMMKILQDAHALVMNMINARKPIISAINGPAAGAGLAVALMADIPIAARNAKLVDAHTRLGVAAGDHAAIIWPLLCGMAKAKYYLLTCDPLTGEEAERIGVVALCADDDKLMDKALEVATRLAEGPPLAIRLTKRALNGWLRNAEPHFDLSLAYEIIGFLGPELPEGASAIRDKRPPKWDQNSVF